MAGTDAKALCRTALEEMASGGGELGAMQDALPELTAFVREFAAPDFTCLMVPMPPTPPVRYEGVESIVEAWGEWAGAFESVVARIEAIRESDQAIVVMVDQRAVTRHGGVEITQPSAMLFAFENGAVARLEFHLDRAAALKAAGLPGS